MIEDLIKFFIKIITKILNVIFKTNKKDIVQKNLYYTKKLMIDTELEFFNKLNFFESVVKK